MPTLQLNDFTLHYEEAGAGEPVLLLHGLGSSGQDWEYVAPRLASHHRVLMPDARGHGRSGRPPGEYGVPLFARDVAALCDALGLERVHVVGFSMGGMMGLQLAVDRPDLVRGLTVINCTADLVPSTLKLKFAFALRMGVLRLLGPQGMAKVLAPKLFPKPEQEALRRKALESIGANEPDAYLRATRGLRGWSVRARLHEVVCPVLVLASDGDYTPLSAKQDYVAHLDEARLQVVRDSCHAAPMDQPEQVIDAVEPFLREVEGLPLAARSAG
ncbi:alpha/beta hydrolase [Myxococcaceae bacterium GXIMD 01537]